MKKEALRVSTTIPAAPTTLYLAWLNPEQHSAMTGGVAKIDPQVGGKFTAWNGYITGKLVTLDLGRRIVMSWRTADFPREASDARVELHFEARICCLAREVGSAPAHDDSSAEIESDERAG
ncbi:MAG TPA: SRPBCC domain-containing protein, partial [Labilithrix sp.]|nr:SRPBCC domain-containing protein [Labilithrix sp.]